MFPELKDYIVKYQDPQQADSIMKIQKELDETKIVLHKTIESVLQRGEKIDDLVAKSDGLSAQSKMFYSKWCFIFTEMRAIFNHRCSSSEETELVLCSDVDGLNSQALMFIWVMWSFIVKQACISILVSCQTCHVDYCIRQLL